MLIHAVIDATVVAWIVAVARVVFGLGGSSVDSYIRALAICNNLAELASSGSKAEFCDRISTLICLKKHWTRHSNAKVVCDSNEAGEDSVDETQLAVELQNISMSSILYDPGHMIKSQRVLVLCSKSVSDHGTSCDGTASENVHQQKECYNVFPSLLTVPSAHASKCLIVS